MNVEPLNSIYKVRCDCGSAELSIEGAPVAENWCHCKNCREWYSKTPVGMVLFTIVQMRIISGSEYLKKANLENPDFDRFFCMNCNYKLYNKNVNFPFVSLPSSNLPGLQFKPAYHIFCIDILPKGSIPESDGLPFYENLPKSAGGSGTLMFN